MCQLVIPALNHCPTRQLSQRTFRPAHHRLFPTLGLQENLQLSQAICRLIYRLMYLVIYRQIRLLHFQVGSQLLNQVSNQLGNRPDNPQYSLQDFQRSGRLLNLLANHRIAHHQIHRISHTSFQHPILLNNQLLCRLDNQHLDQLFNPFRIRHSVRLVSLHHNHSLRQHLNRVCNLQLRQPNSKLFGELL